MLIDDPATIAEITTQFAAYESALMTNNVAALDSFFWNSPLAIRFGAGESLFGFPAIAAFRAARGPSPMRKLQNTQITAFGTEHAITTTEFIRNNNPQRGRQTQIWIKFPAQGWKIVSAHVSWEQA